MKLDIGIIGLSVMGRSLALNMADHGFLVAGYNRSASVTEQVVKEHYHKNLFPFYTLPDFVNSLSRPRKVMLMIQAGNPVDLVIEQLTALLEKGDIILDGGNSFYEDTKRRAGYLKEKGIRYLGVGISGGEEGARFGPSIMPGGEKAAYEEVRNILETIAAKAKGEPCCAYIGPEGAGHYVKMVHNGIEYADMQLIAEAYLLLKQVGGFSNQELAHQFELWKEGELNSFLIQITADILREPDDRAPGELIDSILDSARQKGTGRWMSIEALKQGVDVSMITAAANARVMSNHLEQRKKAANLIKAPSRQKQGEKKAFASLVREALVTGKIIAYAQGFSLMADASQQFGWDLNLDQIASIFRAGCIIQADILTDIMAAFQENKKENLIFDGFFAERINRYQESLRTAVSIGILNGVPMPALSNAVSYLDALRAESFGANLIQAQRDYFGAHTFERKDQDGIFHHDWRR